MDYKKLSDDELEVHIKQTVQEENKLKTQILHLLAEVERRRLYSKEHPSLFEYCVKVLKYSASSAQRRIDAMRALKLIPEIEEKILTGELNLSSVSQAQTFFRQESKTGKTYSVEQKKEVLKKLENKSTRECIQELVAISPNAIPQERRRELTTEKTEMKIVLNKELVEKLDQLKALMSNKNPHMTDAELISVMADICLQKLDPAQKKVKKSLPASVVIPIINLAKPSRYIPSAIKKEVYLRDKGQCTYKNPRTGEQCCSRKFLEYDHVWPLAKGGKTIAKNLRLLCRTHNQRVAINLFGQEKMQQYL